MKVFVVEDNPVAVANIEQALASVAGSRIVEVVATEEEARAWFRDHPRDWNLAVIDLFLKQGHGFRVLQACLDRAPDQRAVVLSNYSREPVREYVEAAGADAFFDKSFELDALVQFCVSNFPAFGQEPRDDQRETATPHGASPTGTSPSSASLRASMTETELDRPLAT